MRHLTSVSPTPSHLPSLAAKWSLLLLLSGSLAAAQVTISPPQAVSLNAAGTDMSNDESEVYQSTLGRRTMTGTGEFFVFTSESTDLPVAIPSALAGSTNGYLFNFVSNTVTLLTPNSAGTATPNNSSDDFSIDDRGERVAFRSQATDHVDSFIDNNNSGSDCYYRDVASSTTTLVSKNAAGTGGHSGLVHDPIMSGSGEFVFYRATQSMDLTNIADGNGTGFSSHDLFRYRISTGVTELVNINLDGTASSNMPVGAYSVNYEGNVVAFESSSSDLHADHAGGGMGVFVRNLSGDETILVTQNAPGSTGAEGTGTAPKISGNGQFVVFESRSTELTGDPNITITRDIFIRDLVANRTTLMSINSSGTSSANENSGLDQITHHGRFVLFHSSATDLAPGTNPNGLRALYRYDRLSQAVELVSVSEAGVETVNSSVFYPSITDSGRLVTYDTRATDVVSGLANVAGSQNVFLRDMARKTTVCLSVNSSGVQVADGDSEYATISRTGSAVVLVTESTDITSFPDTNNEKDVIACSLDLDRILTTFCDPMDVNSTGISTTLSGAFSSGSQALFGLPQVSDLNLQCTSGVPGQFGYFLIGSGVDDPGVTLGSGRLCLSVTGTHIVARYNESGIRTSIGQFDSSGVLQNLVGTANSTGGSGFDVPYQLPGTSNQSITLGSTWHFQVWHREVNGTSNLSNGLSVTF